MSAIDLMRDCTARAWQGWNESREDFDFYLLLASQAALVVIAESLANHEQGAPDE